VETSNSATGDAKTAAIVLADVVDSTYKHAVAGDAVARLMWTEHDRAARQLLRQWNGREIGRSDGFLLLFETCDDALSFAVAYHRVLAGIVVPMSARVGIHWGEVVLRNNSPEDIAGGATPFEVDGLALPLAARVMAAAEGGQTLLSVDAMRALVNPLSQGLPAVSHGHWRLKGVSEPLELFEVAATGVAMAPPPPSAKAYRVVQRAGLWVAADELPNNLGAEPDAFIGREASLHELVRMWDRGARLITLVGTGGIGKTRLAQRYGRGWLGSHPGGAWFCDLSATRTLDGIVHAVAQAMEVPLGRADPVEQLATAMAGRGSCLIVLDNFEQVAREAQATLGVWLQRASNASFLVTSREVLGLKGEQVLVLPPLDPSDAQSLFRNRMCAAGLVDNLAEEDNEALPQLVELLDCLPLAIELAAARALVIAPAGQVQRIGDRFRLLAGRSGRPDRQATLRATLDWSWGLLGSSEQSALAQLTVFEGGFTLAGAEAVVDLSIQVDAPWVAHVLHSLVEKSLVRRLPGRRFDLLRTVHDYAAEHLLSTNAADAQHRHWLYFSGLSEREATRDRCIELDNLIIACRRAGTDPAGEGRAAVGALVNSWAALRLVGPFRVALALAQPLAQRSDLAPREQALVQRVLGGAAGLLGRTADAQAHYECARQAAISSGGGGLAAQLVCLIADLELQGGELKAAETALQSVLASDNKDDTARLMAWNGAGHLAMMRSEWMSAQQHFGAALRLAEKLGDRRREGGLHGNLGTLAMLQGHWSDANEHLEMGLAIADEVGDRQWAGNAHCNLGLLLHMKKNHQAAQAELLAALRGARHMGQRRLEAVASCNLGLVLQALGEPETAREHFEKAVEIARALPWPRLEGQSLGYLGALLGSHGNAGAAISSFAAAESLFAASDDVGDLAFLSCQRAISSAAQGQWHTAAKELEEANKLSAKLAILPGSELGQAIAAAQDAVNSRS
jgi:predicted ATPase/Tfp pilus assembly protein PilF